MSEGTTKTEAKTTAATWASFLASGAALALLQGLDLSGLPGWAVVPAGMVLTSGITWLVAYNTAHKPSKLSISAVRAMARH
jgi:hypothetical protein